MISSIDMLNPPREAYGQSSSSTPVGTSDGNTPHPWTSTSRWGEPARSEAVLRLYRSEFRPTQGAHPLVTPFGCDEFAISSECQEAAVRQCPLMAGAGCSSRRVHRQFADGQAHVLICRFGVRSSESRPSQVGQLQTSRYVSFKAPSIWQLRTLKTPTKPYLPVIRLTLIDRMKFLRFHGEKGSANLGIRLSMTTPQGRRL